MDCFVLGLIVAFEVCGIADTKAIDTGKIQIKGKWCKLARLGEMKNEQN